MEKKILLVGPLPPPITGVTLANRVVRDNLEATSGFKLTTINTSLNSFEGIGSFSLSKLWFYIRLNILAFKTIGHDIIYIVPGQTFYGVTKFAGFILLGSLSRKRIIQHIHGNHLGRQYTQLSGWKKSVFHYLLSKTETGIVLSESLKPNFTAFIDEDHIKPLYNFAEDSLFEPLQTNVEGPTLRITYLSNLMEEKGIHDLLDALLELEGNGMDYEARIAGNIANDDRLLIKQKLDQLKNTTYIGVIDLQAKVELLNWSNVFILPTYYIMEGQPISILEAMATGNVILTTDHAGIPDIFIDSLNGFYVEKRSPRSIVTTLTRLQNDPSLITGISKQNRKEAGKKYRVANFTANLIKILND